MPTIVHLLRPIALALMLTLTATSFSQATVDTSAMDAATLHKKLTRRGIGKAVKITQVNGDEIKGTLVSIDEDGFRVKPNNAVQPTRISNTQVHKLDNVGLSRGAKIGITVGICMVALGIIGSRT